jgi:hypothetical protein
MSDTALDELTTIAVLPRMLSEMISSPEVGKDRLVNTGSNCKGKEHTKLVGPIPTLHVHLTVCKVEQVAKDREALGTWWKRQRGSTT